MVLYNKNVLTLVFFYQLYESRHGRPGPKSVIYINDLRERHSLGGDAWLYIYNGGGEGE